MKWTQEVGNVSVKEAVPIGPQNGPCGGVSCYTFHCLAVYIIFGYICCLYCCNTTVCLYAAQYSFMILLLPQTY